MDADTSGLMVSGYHQTLMGRSSRWHCKLERPLTNAQQPFNSAYLLCITNGCFRVFSLAANGSFNFLSMTAQGRQAPAPLET